MGQAVILCAYLQLLDFVSTAVFLANGAQEANPLVRASFALSANPLVGLACIKILAILLLGAAWTAGKHRVIRGANIGYAALILWNLTAALAATA